MTTRIGSGDRRTKIDILEPIETVDATGQMTRDFHIKKTVWGFMTALRGNEIVVGGQQIANATHRAIIPFVRNMTTVMKFRVRDKEFGIQSFADKHDSEVELHCILKEKK